MDWNKRFRTYGVDMRWSEKSPVNKVARCDRTWSHIVQADSPRLQVDNGQGPERKRGHGKLHQYLCVACALAMYGQRPPSPMDDNQGELF